MNMNQFAVLITKKEGKKKQVDIAQTKEILSKVQRSLKMLTKFDMKKELAKVPTMKVDLTKSLARRKKVSGNIFLSDKV